MSKFEDINRFLQERKGEKKYIKCANCGYLIKFNYCEHCFPDGTGDNKMGEFARDNNGNILFNLDDDNKRRRVGGGDQQV